jgi:hypothetical protein
MIRHLLNFEKKKLRLENKIPTYSHSIPTYVNKFQCTQVVFFDPIASGLHENSANKRMETNICHFEPFYCLPQSAHVWIRKSRVEENTCISSR